MDRSDALDSLLLGCLALPGVYYAALRIPVSTHYAVWDVIQSETGGTQWPNPAQLVRLVRGIRAVLQPARNLLGKLTVTSGLRSRALNEAIGGAARSDHLLGNAFDIVPVEMTRDQAFETLKHSDIPYDQLIKYRSTSHIHIGWRSSPRRQAFESD